MQRTKTDCNVPTKNNQKCKKIVNKYTFTISNDFVILRRHSDLFKLSTNDNLKIFVGQVEELENEKRQQIAKLKAQEKRVDHLERAKRKEEIPLLLEAIKQVSLETDVEYFDFEGIFSAIWYCKVFNAAKY